MIVDELNRYSLERFKFAEEFDKNPAEGQLRKFAVLGRPIEPFELRIRNLESQEIAGEREVGEIEVRGNSITPGYYKNQKATMRLFKDSWLLTGDEGYLIDGRLVVCGRIKDIIIIGARNIYPEGIEWAVGKIPGVRPGNVITFGVNSKRAKERELLWF